MAVPRSGWPVFAEGEEIDMDDVMQKKQAGYGAYLVLGLAAVLLSLWSLGYRGLWASEGRWAEVTREMLLSGDFFHPNINGQPYFDKPLLTYWLVAAVSLVTGHLNEWTVRLPSALSLLAAVAITVWLGLKLWSRQVGLTAGWFLLSTYSILFWSRTGVADVENLAVILLAVAWYWAWRDRPNFFTFLVFYLILFLGAQLKGLTAVVVPIAALLPDVVRERRWRSYLSFSHVLALLLGSLFYLAPFFYASMTRPDYQSSGLALVFQENIQRYFDPIDHVEPFYIYFYEVPILLLPWVPLFAGALLAGLPRWRQLDSQTRWLIQAVAMIFLFFSASGSRRSYYILPIVPFIALWLAAYVGNAGGYGALSSQAIGRLLRWLQQLLIYLLALLEVASPLLLPLVAEKTGFVVPAGLPLATLLTGTATLGVLLLDWRRPDWLARLTGTPAGIGGLLVAVSIILGGYFCWQMRPLEIYRTERPFALQLKSRLGDLPPERLVFYEKPEPNVLFYLDLPRPATLMENPEQLRDFMEKSRDEYILVIRRRTMEALAATLPQLAGRQPGLAEESFAWQKPSKKLIAYHFGGN
ncbi:MAG: glycosyltransferase family 39 protein [Thermodesulfobacteriota bacterium]